MLLAKHPAHAAYRTPTPCQLDMLQRHRARLQQILAAWLQQTRRSQVLQQAVARLMHKTLAQSFTGWKQAVKDKLCLQAKLHVSFVFHTLGDCLPLCLQQSVLINIIGCQRCSLGLAAGCMPTNECLLLSKLAVCDETLELAVPVTCIRPLAPHDAAAQAVPYKSTESVEAHG